MEYKKFTERSQNSFENRKHHVHPARLLSSLINLVLENLPIVGGHLLGPPP